MTPTICFLSDYGLSDEFVGVVHGVLAAGCPDARIIDIAHGVPRHNVLAGALTLARALPFMPAGVHLAVVDPGVGTPRHAVALRCAREPWLLVGPDNGLLWPAAQAGGGVSEAVEISASPWRREPVSATFHGRDVFAPVAARLASGASLRDAGSPLDPAELTRLYLPEPRRGEDGTVSFGVVACDGYGNLGLAFRRLEDVGLRPGERVAVSAPSGAVHFALVGRTFADVEWDGLVLYEDAGGMLALAVNGGSAAERLGAGTGDSVVVARG